MTSGVDQERRLLTKAALAEPSIAVAAWSEWSETFKGPHSSSQLSWAGGYIYKNLLVAGVNDDYVKGLYRHNWTKNNHARAKTLPALREMSKALDVLLLKSYGFTHSEYSLGFRPIADIDLYVNEEQLEDAAELLMGFGYPPLLGLSIDVLAKKVLLQRGSWNFKHPDGSDIDLHWKLFDHMSAHDNAVLVEKHSTYRETEFGQCRVLNAELSMAYQIHVFALQNEKRFNGLFDAYAIARQADMSVTIDLIQHIGLIDAAYSLTEELCSTLDLPLEHPIRRLHQEVVTVPRTESAADIPRVRLSRIDLSDIRHPRLYAWWFLHGQPRWLEVLHHLILGSMTQPGSGVNVDVLPAVHTFADANQIPPGFHYQYPQTKYRWTHRGDARVRFNINAKMKGRRPRGSRIQVRVTVDEEHWSISPTHSVVVYANGKKVGRLTKDETSVSVEQRVLRSTLELSFRTTDADDPLESSAHFNWHQMLMPIVSVEIRANKSQS